MHVRDMIDVDKKWDDVLIDKFFHPLDVYQIQEISLSVKRKMDKLV